MLLNKERRRSLQKVLVSLPPHWPRAAPPQSRTTLTPAPPTAESARQPSDARLQLTGAMTAAPPAESPPRRTLRAERRSEMTLQERAVVAHSFRARYALSDRQLLAHLRRQRRVELLDEIARLSRVAKGLQDQISATERRIQTMDRVATRFERVAELLKAASGAAPASARPAAVSALTPSIDATSEADDK